MSTALIISHYISICAITLKGNALYLVESLPQNHYEEPTSLNKGEPRRCRFSKFLGNDYLIGNAVDSKC